MGLAQIQTCLRQVTDLQAALNPAGVQGVARDWRAQ